MKTKCDFCGRKELIETHTMKIIGKPKINMTSEERTQRSTHLGDNKTFEKRICESCRTKKRER